MAFQTISTEHFGGAMNSAGNFSRASWPKFNDLENTCRVLALRFENQDYFFCMASESANGGSHDEVKTAILRIFGSHEAAELAAANLEAHGMECWINADDCGGMYPNLTTAGGVRLLVRAADAKAATALLNAQASPAEISQIEAEAAASSPLETAPLKKLSWGQILFGVVLGVILCLLCQWANKLGTKTFYHYTKDGKRDKVWVYRYGYLAEFSEDRNLDGKWDHWVHYDEHGQVSKSEYDNNFDGKPDETWTYSNGFSATLEKDNDFNGNVP
jgi:hypothetical protein